MKRCPKCEFTFDDYQEFCDFDGAELSLIPEFVPSLKNLSLPATTSPSLFLRVARSRVSLAGLSLAVVTLSALMIGYYDAANAPDSVSGPNSERGETVQVNKSSQADTSKLVQSGRSPQRPTYVSMERRVTSAEEASSMPSPMIKWLAEDPESQPAQSRPAPPRSKAPATVQANIRRPARSQRHSLTDNQRSGSRKANKVAHRRPDGDFAGTRRQKDSRVVAILKKTGSILTWPFKL
jgi:hypothetical protein